MWKWYGGASLRRLLNQRARLCLLKIKPVAASMQLMLFDYDYNLPSGLIAQQPADPRDSSKVLIYKRETGEVFFDVFKNVLKYVPERTLFVFNQTRVVPACLPVIKETGGRADLLYVRTAGDLLVFLSSKLLKPGSSLRLDQHTLKVLKKEGKFYFLKADFPTAKLYEVMDCFGKTPLPPYIKNCPLDEDDRRQKYQAVFAQKEGSVAAPTASLHFTPELLEKMDKAYVTLHVNLGTFAPVTGDQIESKKLHEERYEILEDQAEIINIAKADGRPVLAVGTTAVRTLESAAKDGVVKPGSGITDLFIQPGYSFQVVDNMITNFHVPRSSLMMLVASMVGREKLLDLYHQAIDKKLRFYSFGDAMLII